MWQWQVMGRKAKAISYVHTLKDSHCTNYEVPTWVIRERFFFFFDEERACLKEDVGHHLLTL